MSEERQDERTTETEATGPAETLLAGVMQTRMLPGEDPELFRQLADKVLANVRPRDDIEELLLNDYVHYTWEALRLRRYKDNLLHVGACRAMVPMLVPLVDDDKVMTTYMAEDWYKGLPGGVEELQELLS